MKRRSFVVRIWLNEDGSIHGQVTDPLTDWRQPFHDSNQLWTLMQHFLTELPASNQSSTIPESSDLNP